MLLISVVSRDQDWPKVVVNVFYFILFSQSYRWGKVEFMPPWWPISLIPFTNPRQDIRPEKTETTHAHCLRQVIRTCLPYHGVPEDHSKY